MPARASNGPYIVIAVLMLFIGFAFMDPNVSASGYLGLAIFGLIASLLGGLGMFVTPFREAFACGLMYVFVPFYWVYYLITRWRTMRRPTLWHFGGSILLAIALIAFYVRVQTAQRGSNRDRRSTQLMAALADKIGSFHFVRLSAGSSIR